MSTRLLLWAQTGVERMTKHTFSIGGPENTQEEQEIVQGAAGPIRKKAPSERGILRRLKRNPGTHSQDVATKDRTAHSR